MRFRLLFAAIALALAAAPALAQTSRGTVSGVVTDPNGAVVAGATVTLTNLSTEVSRTTTSNDEGFYRFDAVDPGNYSIKFSAQGFSDLTKTNIPVQAGLVADIGGQLTLGQAEITIDVTAEGGALLQTEAPVRGGNIPETQITELPIALRNPVSLALTLPGISTNRYGAGVATFSVNGARQRSNNFLLDGTENNDISVAGQGFQVTNTDAVKEVSVQTSNYDAEFGRAGGAVVNVITKSGTNEFHGTLSYLGDSTRDDAITAQGSRSPDVQARGHNLPGTEHWFSGTVGGPVILPRLGEGGRVFGYDGRNRTFFFLGLQDRRQGSTSSTSVIAPTAAGRARLRSLFPAGVNPRVDTYLAVTNGVNGTANPFTLDLGLGRGGIEFATASPVYAQTLANFQAQVRIDHQIGPNDQFSARYVSDFQVLPVGGVLPGSFPDLITSQANKYQNFLLTETHVFSPNLTNEARLSYNRIDLSFPLDPQNPLGLTLPCIQITTLSSCTTAGTQLSVNPVFPQGRVANNYVVQDTMTLVRGDHTFRFGADLLMQRSRQFAPIIERGSLTYTDSSVNVGGTNVSFTGFANFVDDFGGSGNATKDFGSPAYYPELFRQAYFFQDRWRANKELTLTLGIRYENFGTPFNNLRTPAFTGLFNVDPVTFEGPFDDPNQIPGDNNNFAPTVGIAYSPSADSGLLGFLFGGEHRSVIRAGYQIGYDSFYNNLASNAATAAPNLVATSTTSTPSAASPRGLANLSQQFPTARRPVTALDSQGNLLAPDLVNPYYQRWSIGLQREMPAGVILDMSYVGSKGTRLYITEDLNPVVPAALRQFPRNPDGSLISVPAARLSTRYDPLQGSRNIRTNGGDSNYHSGQLMLSRRFANNFSVTGSYTWSKLIDNGSDTFAQAGVNSQAFTALPSRFGGLRADRGVSLYDRTHRAAITYVYAFPFFREQRGFAGHLLGGWEISGVTQFESGVPLNILNGTDADLIGGNLDRPVYNPDGQRGVRARIADATSPSPTGYVNPDVVIGTTSAGANIFQPIDPLQAEYIQAGSARFPVGNLGRNTLRTPGINNWDMNVMKRTRLGETTSLELRTEFFNVFNHPQYGTPSVSSFLNVGQTGVGGTISSTLPGRFLDPRFGDGGGRVIRYQLKFIF
ncbi:MAG TPA: carboxypeptidase regulatory-like domain-containing protein [Pyrinomonadaceae bacterium]|nr:carboxypeptidase regulatory-like domain-containing protein [Pyrinomonadaceae bacterium]